MFSTAFARWSAFAIRFRWLVLGVTLLAALAGTRYAREHLTLDTRWERLYSPEQMKVVEYVRRHFAADDTSLLLVHGDVLSANYLRRMQGLQHELDSLDLELPSRQRPEPAKPPQAAAAAAAKDDFLADFAAPGAAPEATAGGSIFEQIISIVNVRVTRWQDGSLRVGGLMDGWEPAQGTTALRAQLADPTTLAAKIVSKQGDYSLVVLRTGYLDQNDTAKVYSALRKLADKHSAPGFDVALAGGATFRTVVAELLVKAGKQFVVLSTLLMMVLLGFIFRHPTGVLAPVVIVLGTVTLTFATMAACGVTLTTQTLILPQFLICVGVADSIHIQSVYATARTEGLGTHEAIVHAMASAAPPVLITSLTTAVGLLASATSVVAPVRELGVFGAVGTMIAFLLTALWLPPLLTFQGKRRFRVEQGPRPTSLLQRALGACERATAGTRGRRWVLFSMVAAAVIGVFGISQLRLGMYPLKWFPERDPMRMAFATIDAKLGGSNELRLMIEPKAGSDLRSRDLLVRLEQLEREILAYRDPELGIQFAGEVTSVLDLVRESWRAFNGGERKAYAIPPDDRSVIDMFTFLQGGARNDLKHFLTLDAGSAIMNVRVQWLDARYALRFTEHVGKRAQALLGDRARIVFTGPSYNIAQVAIALVSQTAQSFAIAFLMVGALVVVLCRSLKLGLIAIVPNALSLGVLLACFGLLRIPLESTNAIYASIALGIVVDDAIHFVHHAVGARHRGLSMDAAVALAFEHAGRAMVFTSAVLGAGFSLRLGEYLRVSRDFGMVMALACSVGLFANLIWVPALLRTFARGPEGGSARDRDRDREQHEERHGVAGVPPRQPVRGDVVDGLNEPQGAAEGTE